MIQNIKWELVNNASSGQTFSCSIRISFLFEYNSCSSIIWSLISPKIWIMNGKNMNSQRISFLSVAWLLLHSSYFLYLYFLLPCGNCSCVTCLFLEGHFGIHLEVASDSFCFLINSSWLLVFILYVFSFFFLGFNLYCWKGIHFSS